MSMGGQVVTTETIQIAPHTITEDLAEPIVIQKQEDNTTDSEQ